MASTAKTRSRRRSAEERRADVVRGAIEEFAERGYHAASTAAIAERAGISQPYIYALFKDKRELFLACHAESIRRIRSAFVAAARGADSAEEAIKRMGEAYGPLVADRHVLLFQLQGYATVADPEIGPVVARGFQEVYDEVRRQSGASDEEVASFMACGMLINVTTAIGRPELAEPALRATVPGEGS